MTNYSIGGSSGTTGLSELAEPLAAGDKIPLVNVSDTTTPPAGSAGSDQAMTASVLGQAIRATVNAVLDYGADPTGGSDATTAIQLALLSFGTATGWLQGQGGAVDLGPGSFHISNTLIIPPGVKLRGVGQNATIITMSTTVAADVVQMEIYNSAAQAAILAATVGGAAPAQADLVNAFYSGVEDLGIHGNSFYTTIPAYSHGINCTTNPLLAQAPGDPAFDPSHHISNVYVQACTGDGVIIQGRSGIALDSVWALSNNGNGITPSFDTLITNCNTGFNGVVGVYSDHGATNGGPVKSYNNGCAPLWTTGQNWSPGNISMYAGTLYFCILAVTGSTTVPSSDGTHWVALVAAGGAWASGTDYTPGDAVTYSGGTYICILAVSGSTAPSSDATHWAAPTPAWVSGTSYSSGQAVTYSGQMYYCLAAISGSTAPSADPAHWVAVAAATSPQAWGYDFAWDSGASGQSWTALDSQEPSAGSFWLNGCTGISITGAGTTQNFNNQSGTGQNGSNPNNYAAVYASSISGCNVTVACSTLGSVAYALAVTSATRSNLMITTDGSEQGILAPGASLAGTAALVNGQVQSVLTGTQSVTSGVVALTFSSTLAVNAALGNHFRVTMTANMTVSAPSNPVDGQKVTFELIQDGTGSRTVTWNAAFDFGAVGAPTLTTTASKRDVVGFVYSGSLSKWLCAGSALGF
jgi:hypothetical protein